MLDVCTKRTKLVAKKNTETRFYGSQSNHPFVAHFQEDFAAFFIVKIYNFFMSCCMFSLFRKNLRILFIPNFSVFCFVYRVIVLSTDTLR